MNSFIARQPIFDRGLKVYGYELLHRKSDQNQFSGIDDDQATAELLYNTFFVMGLNDLTDHTRGFINFSKEMIDSKTPYILPKKSIIIEVLERKNATEATVDACKKLRSMGYTIALDDFIFDDGNMPLIALADIIKVEYPAVDPSVQRSMIKKYHSKIKFLAEKIETREEFRIAFDMGYDYFQGYFFSRPSIVMAKEVETLNINLLRIIEEMNRPEPSVKTISDIVSSDLGLSYKLLKLVNSVYFESFNKIQTISQAVVYVGIQELSQWFTIMLVKDMQNVENAEIVKLSIIRAKMMGLLAEALHLQQNQLDCFFTGMFSFLDVLMNQPMNQLLEGLPLAEDVKQALLGADNLFRRLLDSVIACEMADWQGIEKRYPIDCIGENKFMEFYLEALRWARRLGQ